MNTIAPGMTCMISSSIDHASVQQYAPSLHRTSNHARRHCIGHAALMLSTFFLSYAIPDWAQAAENTWTFQYDAQGNQTSTLDPLGHERKRSYDSLGRAIQELEPNSASTVNPSGTQGTIKFILDGQDRTTAVSDPRGLTTIYTVDGLGNATTVTSPDSGSTINTYDAAGNVTTRTDARGVKGSYTYDALNRLTKATYVKSGLAAETLSFSWDTAINGIGRLAASSANIGDGTSNAFAYDLMGRVVRSEYRTGALHTNIVRYAYDSFGRLSQITYPSGRRVAYAYDINGRVNKISVDGVVQLSNITYQAFGSVAGWTWGNGQKYLRTFDAAGPIKSHTVGKQTRNILYDGADRIKQLDEGTAASKRNYRYDNLDRLLGYTTPSTSRTYGYDLNGNLNLLTVGGASHTNAVDPKSNRLTASSGPAPAKSYTYDGAGNLTGDGTRTNTYGTAGRLLSAQAGSALTRYALNAHGQRVAKWGTGITGSIAYVYDEQGHLIGEYDNTDVPIQETVWLGDTPVLVLKKSSQEVIVDNTAAAFTGTWATITTPVGFYGSNARSHAAAAGTEAATWTPTIPTAQSYRVYARWSAQATNSSTATYAIKSQGGTANVSVNQQTDGGQWNYLGSFAFAPSAGKKITLTQKADGIVIADAIKLVPDTVTATNAATYFIDADHLDTPRVIRDSQNRIAWSWDSDPYGAVQPNENPSGLGAFTYNLRFPGQVYDKETGLAYNYLRDGYDAITARYTQSDPIGLNGGSWTTYAYVEGNPLSYVDPTGEIAFVPIVIGIGVGYAFDYLLEQYKKEHCTCKDTPAGAAGNSAAGGAVGGSGPFANKPRGGAAGGGPSGTATSSFSQMNHAAASSGWYSNAWRHRITGVLRKVPYAGSGLAAYEIYDAISCD